MRKPILCISPSSYPGTMSVLKHYNVTGLTEHSEEISDETVGGRGLVILGAWHPIYYEALQKLKAHNVPTALFWTSSVGQMDFSNNGMEISYIHLIKDMVVSGLLDRVILGTPQNLDMFQQFVPKEKTVYLPYAFDWDEVQKFKDDTIEIGERWIDLFCPLDTRKNPLVQIHGAKLANAHLHFSGLPPRYRFFSELIGVKFTDMGWMKKESYYKAVQTMRLGLQATYAETFDYVVAEHFALERPCLISTVMGSWVDSELWDELMVYNIDDPLEVRDKIRRIIHYSEDEYKYLYKRCHDFMRGEAERRNSFAKKVLENLVEEN